MFTTFSTYVFLYMTSKVWTIHFVNSLVLSGCRDCWCIFIAYWGSYMTHNDCMGKMKLSICIVEFLKCSTAFSLSRVPPLQLLNHIEVACLHLAYFTTSWEILIILEVLYWRKLYSIEPCLEILKMPALVVHDMDRFHAILTWENKLLSSSVNINYHQNCHQVSHYITW